MRVRRQVDSARSVVRITIEYPIAMDPDLAGDRAWEVTTREMKRVQDRDQAAVDELAPTP